MSDDAGYADFGFMAQLNNHPTQFKTPNLDQLASQSVLASNAYVGASQCAISRAALMTGLVPDRYGFSFNAVDDDKPNESFKNEPVFVSDRLKQLGYTTAAIGKWHLGMSQPQWLPGNQGFDNFYGFLDATHNYFNTAGDQPIYRGTTPIDWAAEPSFNNIPNDPTNGRYLTDAIGDEASKFIAQNAGGANPFFLYVPFFSPHSPLQAKQQDLAEFNGTTLTGNRKSVAAMTYALDRAVGNILKRVSDPNGDGFQNDSIANNTIVVFMNDNGGPTNVTSGYDNFPLAGFKGTGYEGGMRTPMLIRAPGVTPGSVFNKTVTSMDFFPTFVAAAGGQMTTPTDGVNLLPFLTGGQTGDVHDVFAVRNRVNYSFVRKGDWKFAKNNFDQTWKLFHLNLDGSGEDVDLSQQYPEMVAELTRDYVDFDVKLDKARNSTSLKVHDFDVFVRRNDVFVNAHWTFGGAWRNGDNPNEITSLSKDDPSPNTVLVFNPNNTADYTSANLRNRASGISWARMGNGETDLPGLGEFMLNEIRFQGEFSGTANRKAVINGLPVMFVNSLTGKAPGLRLDAMVTSNKTYTYQLDLDSVLYNDLVIEGDGNANFQIGGVMRNFWNPSGVTKRGTSTVSLLGHNTYTGDTLVEQGRIIVDGANAAIDGSGKVRVLSGGRLTLQAGLIRTGELNVSQGTFDFLGGTLRTDKVIGSLTKAAGTFIVGSEQPTSSVSGSFTQTGGTLDLHVMPELIGTPASVLTIGGQAQLGGQLVVNFDEVAEVPYQLSLPLIFATGGLSGTFSQVVVPGFPSGTQWSLNYTANAVTLSLSQSQTIGDSADFNFDGIVDGLDFLRWQQNQGTSGPKGDANYDGHVDAADLAIWMSQFGGPPPQNPVSVQAPEPQTLGLVCFAAIASLHVVSRRRLALCAAQ